LTWVKPILFSLVLLVGSLRAGDATARKLVTQVNPEYPDIAARMSIHGTVKFRVWVAPDGAVRRVEYIGGHPLLAEAALKAIKIWKFVPASKQSVEMIQIRF
jgi:TonB family protein